jgi:antitoxin (DNA-binding transcriptional repressor) of toxin-antitoxin stability system
VEASFVDLRKKSAEIIRALSRKERVTVLYRGKPAAVMEPIDSRVPGETVVASQHKAFGLWADHSDSPSVDEQIRNLRRRRFDDL